MTRRQRFARRLAQLRCGLLGGHAPVTRWNASRIWTACYLCDRVLGAGGWSTAGLRPPRRRTSVIQALDAWLRKGAA